jgi:hypothetical protein
MLACGAPFPFDADGVQPRRQAGNPEIRHVGRQTAHEGDKEFFGIINQGLEAPSK